MRRRLAASAAALLAMTVPLARGAEIVQKGNLRVSFSGKITPRLLPRRGTAPIAVTVGGRITTTDGSQPAPLSRLKIAINRGGRLDYAGLPTCRLSQIQPATTANALAACGPAKVGEGSFTANVAIPKQSPFPSQGRIVAFNGTEGGRPVILAHVYGTSPLPISFTLTLHIGRTSGTFGTVLHASLPALTSDIAFVTGVSLTLDRRFSYHGRTHGYVAAGCPAPQGFSGVIFPLAQASFVFAGGPTLSSTLVQSCRARG